MPRKESVRRKESRDDDDRPRKKKAKKKQGASVGFVVGLVSGGLLVVVLVVLGIALALRGGGSAGSPGRTKTVSLDARRSYADRIGLEANRHHQITVTSELSDPQTEIEITVFTQDLGGRSTTLATNRCVAGCVQSTSPLPASATPRSV